jgi:hypothetical protein
MYAVDQKRFSQTYARKIVEHDRRTIRSAGGVLARQRAAMHNGGAYTRGTVNVRSEFELEAAKLEAARVAAELARIAEEQQGAVRRAAAAAAEAEAARIAAEAAEAEALQPVPLEQAVLGEKYGLGMVVCMGRLLLDSVHDVQFTVVRCAEPAEFNVGLMRVSLAGALGGDGADYFDEEEKRWRKAAAPDMQDYWGWDGQEGNLTHGDSTTGRWAGQLGYEQGDTLGLRLDVAQETLSAYKNGQCLGVLARGLRSRAGFYWCAGMSSDSDSIVIAHKPRREDYRRARQALLQGSGGEQASEEKRRDGPSRLLLPTPVMHASSVSSLYGDAACTAVGAELVVVPHSDNPEPEPEPEPNLTDDAATKPSALISITPIAAHSEALGLSSSSSSSPESSGPAWQHMCPSHVSQVESAESSVGETKHHSSHHSEVATTATTAVAVA